MTVVVVSDTLRKVDWSGSSMQQTRLMRFDVTPVSPDYWLSIRMFIRWLSLALPKPSAWERASYKELRTAHHKSKRKAWDEVLPSDIAKWAWRQLSAAKGRESCADNYRAARKGNTAQMRRYKRQKDNGCCGFCDFEAVGPDGKTYLLGFNYGH